jgi:hypothetical protein
VGLGKFQTTICVALVFFRSLQDTATVDAHLFRYQ